MNNHIVQSNNAQEVWDWIATRGGIAIWRSIDLSNLGATWTTPLNDDSGTPVTKPTWESESSPSRVIKDPPEVMVSLSEEVQRFRVAIRMENQGLMVKLTDASAR